MKNKTLTVAFVVLLVLSCFNVFTVYAFASKPEFIDVIIGFKGRPSISLITGLGGTVNVAYNNIPAVACSIPVRAIEALMNNPQIEYLEENSVISITGKGGGGKPPKPPKLPKAGYIEVRAFIDAIEVPLPYKVDGVWTGVTLEIIELTPAIYIVTISYGGETIDQAIEVRSRRTSLAYFQFTEAPPIEQGTLQIITTPIDGEVFINSISEGLAPITKDVDVGSYTISFGTVSGYTTPDPQTVSVYENQITYVEGDYQIIPPQPELSWGLDRIDAELAWAVSTGVNIQVAVLDTGIDNDHPDLEDNILAGISFLYYSSIPFLWNPSAWDDDMGHGTWCAGIIEDVAPDVDLVAVKIMDAMGFGTIGDVIAGIDWCMDNYIDVISMSFVDPTYSSAFHDISNMAYIQGIVLIGASGNDGDGNPATNDVLYPAKFDGVIAVSGIDEYDVVASFSSDGAEVEICAPAVNIESTWMGGGYQTHDGTSGACPYVSGTVALIRSTDINLPQFDGYDLDSDGKWDSWEIRNRLEDTADDLGDAGRDIFYGYGLVDAQEAVTGVQTTP